MLRHCWLLLPSLAAACGGGSSSSGSPGAPTPPPANCSFSIPADQTTKSVTAAGGEITVPVSAVAGCTWTASSGASFITVTQGTSSGSGIARLTVAANTGDARLGSATVAGTAITVSQNASTCVTSVSPASRSIRPDLSLESAAVSAPAGCSWEVRSLAGFMSVPSNARGTGNGTFAFTVSENLAGRDRQGLLSVGGAALLVTQSAALGTIVNVPVSPSPIVQIFSAAQTITLPPGQYDHVRFSWYDEKELPNAAGALFVLDRLYTGRLQDLSASTAGVVAEAASILRDEYLLPDDVVLAGGTQYFFAVRGSPRVAYSRSGSLYEGGEFYSLVNVLFSIVRPEGSNTGTVDASFRVRATVR